MGLRQVAELYRELTGSGGSEQAILQCKLKFSRIQQKLGDVNTYVRRLRHERNEARASYEQMRLKNEDLMADARDLDHFVHHDQQTGLPNRRMFNRDIERLLAGLMRSSRLRHVAILVVGLV